MKIAVVTGASSGIGREFARQIPHLYRHLDELWVVARRTERLKELERTRRFLCGSLTEISGGIISMNGCKKNWTGKMQRSVCWSMLPDMERQADLKRSRWQISWE